MPGLSGDVVLRSLKRLDPDLPIIVVTAHGSISGAVTAIRDGAFEYVTKPFRNDQLLETVRRAVAGRRVAADPAFAGSVGAALAASMGQGPAIQALIATSKPSCQPTIPSSSAARPAPARRSSRAACMNMARARNSRWSSSIAAQSPKP